MTRFIHADVRQGLASIATGSVHCVVTSPPYWGLRNYGIEPTVWGGSESCTHEWGEEESRAARAYTHRSNWTQGINGQGRIDPSFEHERPEPEISAGQFCQRCGAWLGCLGLEPSPELFIEHIVEILRGVRRVLHPSGTAWVNFGDCYVANPHGRSPSFDPRYPGGRDRREGDSANRSGHTGLKSKDLVMMPARVAIALQEDGWYLRQQIPWLKRNGMPESCVDRPASMVEYIFLLSVSESYFYDRAAVLMPQAEHERTRRLREQANGMSTVYSLRRDDTSHGQHPPSSNGVARSVVARQQSAQQGTRNRRNTDWYFDSQSLLANPQPFGFEYCEACGTVFTRRGYRKLPIWSIVTKRPICSCQVPADWDGTQIVHEESTWLSHFATFPEAMVEPCVLAGTSAMGACASCASPVERIIEKPKLGDWNRTPGHKGNGVNRNSSKTVPWPLASEFRATCSHPLFPAENVPCVVLDPFGGSGTVAVVAERLGREAILIDANAAYLRMARYRIDLARRATKPQERRAAAAGGATASVPSGGLVEARI